MAAAADGERQALAAGEIDIYPEYTGNGAFFFDRPADPAWKQAQSAYDLVKRLVWAGLLAGFGALASIATARAAAMVFRRAFGEDPPE